MGKIPVLILADGTTIPVPETILEYLELMRVTENYVTPPTTRLFTHFGPHWRDQAVVNSELARAREGLGYLDRCICGS